MEHCLGMLVASISYCIFMNIYWRYMYWKRYFAKMTIGISIVKWSVEGACTTVGCFLARVGG